MNITNVDDYPAGWWDEIHHNHLIWKEQNIILYLNPTDQRCIRVVIRVIDEQNPRKMFNLCGDAYEDCIQSMFPLASKWRRFISSNGFIPQLLELGNNSHGYVDDKIVIGVKEPRLPHLHILFRGINNSKGSFKYVTYFGPDMGELVDLKEGKVMISREDIKSWVEELRDSFRNFMQ